MATKVKGFFKGLKQMPQIFVDKEQEMEIGYPTDVKHIAHIGWDGGSARAPSWMNEFKSSFDFPSWDPKAEFDQPRGLRLSFRAIEEDSTQPDTPRSLKKINRKRRKISSSSRSSRRSSNLRSSYATAIEDGNEVKDQLRGV